MATIYLFRHGQTEFNRDKIFTGWKDSKLTSLGIKQAQGIASLLKDKRIDYAYQTRLSRSQDTLAEVLRLHSECQKIITDDRMIERSYGDLSGLSHQEVINDYGKEQYDKWHRDFYDTPPNGENFEMVEERVKDFIIDLKNKYSQLNFGIAISAHGNSIRLFRKIMEKSTIEETCSWTIPYDQYFEYKI
ncbi:MAG TPA: histidine phosphatase family protein [Spirochaetia bacterium]|nr:histidine phosphatase family protein [Spirochaetia bacterium]